MEARDALPLSITRSGAIPEDIGSAADDLWTLNRKMKLEPISIHLGTLTAG